MRANEQLCATRHLSGRLCRSAWHVGERLKPERLDTNGGLACIIQERIDPPAQQLAKGQEQLVLLLFTAIVTYWTRGQVKAGLMGSMDSIAARSTKLQAEISNKQFTNWLARNEQKLLALPELQVNGPAPLKNVELDNMREYYAKQDSGFAPLKNRSMRLKHSKLWGCPTSKLQIFYPRPKAEN